MRSYTIVRRSASGDWNEVPVLPIDNALKFRDVTHIKAQAQICYDDDALYVRMQAAEPDIRAEHTGLLDEICEDSCLEFFFCPAEGDSRYFNLEVNLNCSYYLGVGSNVRTLLRLIPECPTILPKAERTEDGWFIEYAFPHEFVRRVFPDYAPAPGKSIRANCYKCGDLTVQPHYLAWQPVPDEVDFTFHCPEHFGIMYFG